MARGLFTSIYGKIDEGIFGSGLFSRHGSTPRYTSSDIRLGGYFGQAEDDDDEDEEEEEVAVAAAASPTRQPKKAVFSKQFAGFPFWLIGVSFLGFSWALRKRRAKG